MSKKVAVMLDGGHLRVLSLRDGSGLGWHVFDLRVRKPRAENSDMTIKGRVEHGVIILPEGVTLPEGAEVTVSCEPSLAAKPKQEKRVEFPLVRSKHPGTLELTSARVAELLDEQDVPSRH